MKALTLWQPWATLIAIGEKTIETRGWKTEYRGPLAIHAAVRPPRPDEFNREIAKALLAKDYRSPEELPLGAIVATVVLQDVFPTRQLELPDLDEDLVRGVPDLEYAYGDFTPGRYGWRIGSVMPVDPVVPIKGARNLWDVPPEIASNLIAHQRAADGVMV